MLTKIISSAAIFIIGMTIVYLGILIINLTVNSKPKKETLESKLKLAMYNTNLLVLMFSSLGAAVISGIITFYLIFNIWIK